MLYRNAEADPPNWLMFGTMGWGWGVGGGGQEDRNKCVHQK